MNNYILFFLLLIIIFIFLSFNKYDFASPGALFGFGFAFSSFFLMINTKNWNYEIKDGTIIIIILTVITYMAGCSLGKKIHTNSKIKKKEKCIKINNNQVIFFIAFLIIICYLIRILDIFSTTGSLNLFTGALQIYRFNPGESNFTSYVRLCDAIMSALIIYETLILVEKIKWKQKKKIKSSMVIILGLLYFALSSSRIELIYVFVYFAIAYYINRENSSKIISLKTLRMILVLIILVYVIFFIAGFLTGKSQVQSSMFDNISLYSGSSIGALDIWLNETIEFGKYFGSVIFKGISNMASLIGITFNFSGDPSIRFINLGTMPHTTNIYTFIAELLSDVGLIGMFFITYIEGILSSYLYKKSVCQYKKNKKFLFCIYLYLSPLIITSSISERYFRVFLTISTILFIVIINYLLRLKRSE